MYAHTYIHARIDVTQVNKHEAKAAGGVNEKGKAQYTTAVCTLLHPDPPVYTRELGLGICPDIMISRF